ncbi:transmembrane protein, putative (macronuclear) [Tetrahymena thermophila SB210]|uniref:Transmembrane protein, putative n=1 Tax=Tetrahymena thermophila (strain SB210) TaxID=312017 RepID=W7X0Q1_TETTS|nr:transmembrane protein, putative [Tetrahymena thermophila SB210]EWS72740.1 transmembrane protein, putative [Tetrahymena thermophila SB210]|eukprot:XP_012654718.1 transmembrane protein, putative [Tetrahymena thermophila SB210]
MVGYLASLLFQNLSQFCGQIINYHFHQNLRVLHYLKEILKNFSYFTILLFKVFLEINLLNFLSKTIFHQQQTLYAQESACKILHHHRHLLLQHLQCKKVPKQMNWFQALILHILLEYLLLPLLVIQYLLVQSIFLSKFFQNEFFIIQDCNYIFQNIVIYQVQIKPQDNQLLNALDYYNYNNQLLQFQNHDCTILNLQLSETSLNLLGTFLISLRNHLSQSQGEQQSLYSLHQVIFLDQYKSLFHQSTNPCSVLKFNQDNFYKLLKLIKKFVINLIVIIFAILFLKFKLITKQKEIKSFIQKSLNYPLQILVGHFFLNHNFS